MKNLLFFLISITSYSQVINFTDANLKAYLVTVNNITVPDSYGYNTAQNSENEYIKIDANNNGEIEVDEALAVYTLYLDPLSVVNDLTGLENFVNLRGLGISNITSIDLSPLINLIWFGSDYANPVLTSVNFGELSNLETISIRSSQVTTLDFSGLTSLTSVNCTDNQLTNVIFSENNALEILGLDNNFLTELNVRSLESLTQLICNNNLLQNLYVNGLQNLYNLRCENNQLSSLLLDDLPQLQTLYCSGNQFAALNFDSLPMLKSLRCSYNQLTSLDFSNNPLFSRLGCRSNNLTSINIKNGFNQFYSTLDEWKWNNNPNLASICADASEIPPIQDFLYACQIGQAVAITSNCGLATSGFENTENISILPNPNNGIFTISNLEKESFIEIYDVLGKKVHEQIINNNQLISMEKVSKGIYFAKIKSDDKVYKTEKIIVE